MVCDGTARINILVPSTASFRELVTYISGGSAVPLRVGIPLARLLNRVASLAVRAHNLTLWPLSESTVLKVMPQEVVPITTILAWPVIWNRSFLPGIFFLLFRLAYVLYRLSAGKYYYGA